MPGQPEPEHIDQLAEAWPEWRLWRSRRGQLACATRRRHLSRSESWHGLAPTLIENDVPTLAARLQEQRKREEVTEAACLPTY